MDSRQRSPLPIEDAALHHVAAIERQLELRFVDPFRRIDLGQDIELTTWIEWGTRGIVSRSIIILFALIRSAPTPIR